MKTLLPSFSVPSRGQRKQEKGERTSLRLHTRDCLSPVHLPLGPIRAETCAYPEPALVTFFAVINSSASFQSLT